MHQIPRTTQLTCAINQECSDKAKQNFMPSRHISRINSWIKSEFIRGAYVRPKLGSGNGLQRLVDLRLSSQHPE